MADPLSQKESTPEAKHFQTERDEGYVTSAEHEWTHKPLPGSLASHTHHMNVCTYYLLILLVRYF